MKRDLAHLSHESFDVLVVGGGIHGAAAARAAAARGLSTALIEQGDFGHATSANSLKILHGGLRYLQHGDLAKFRDSVRARRALLRRFGQLAAPLPCVLPTHGLGLRSRPMMAAALLINDLLSLDRNLGVDPACRLPRGGTISKAELIRRAPHLADGRASGGALWYDGIALDTERLVLGLVLDADAAGASVANRVRAAGFLRRGDLVEGVRARDELSGGEFEIRARVTITAAGPWLGELHRPLAGGSDETALAKAINIVVGRRIFGDTAVGVEGGGTGRLFFFVPWRGGTMIGTLYLPHAGPPGACAVTTSDIEQMVGEVNRIHPAAKLCPEEVRFAHVGLLPLDPGRDLRASVESGLMKRPRLIDAAREFGVEGLVGVVGIKYTTGMTVGARAADLASGKLGHRATRPAGERRREPATPATLKDFDAALIGRLALTYGAAAESILRDLAANGAHGRRIAHDQQTTAAEVRHAVREEMALSLADIVLRRTPLGTFGHPGRAVLAACAALAGDALAWDAPRRELEIDLVEAEYRRLGARETRAL
ncbi:MAG: glycerol-3-phosphate dehydrogenase/oxidase [Candidatus Methylomirabilia bacterium]